MSIIRKYFYLLSKSYNIVHRLYVPNSRWVKILVQGHMSPDRIAHRILDIHLFKIINKT